jgi:hypothetical protein
MFDPSAEKFAALGENRIAYIKAIRAEEVAFLSAQAPLLLKAASHPLGRGRRGGHCFFETLCIIGSRAASANVLIRTLLVVTSGSPQT